MGRMLPERIIFGAKQWQGLGKTGWLEWGLESSCSSLNLWRLLGFAYHKDALELLVYFDDIHFLAPCKQVISGIA